MCSNIHIKSKQYLTLYSTRQIIFSFFADEFSKTLMKEKLYERVSFV